MNTVFWNEYCSLSKYWDGGDSEKQTAMQFAGIELGASYEGRLGICKHANTKFGVPVNYLCTLGCKVWNSE